MRGHGLGGNRRCSNLVSFARPHVVPQKGPPLALFLITQNILPSPVESMRLAAFTYPSVRGRDEYVDLPYVNASPHLGVRTHHMGAIPSLVVLGGLAGH